MLDEVAVPFFCYFPGVNAYAAVPGLAGRGLSGTGVYLLPDLRF